MRRTTLLVAAVVLMLTLAATPASGRGGPFANPSVAWYNCLSAGPPPPAGFESWAIYTPSSNYDPPGASPLRYPRLLELHASNPCWVWAMISIRGPDQLDVIIAVPPQTTVTLRPPELAAAGLFPFSLVATGGGFNPFATYPCYWDPDFIVGPDGVLVPAVC